MYQKRLKQLLDVLDIVYIYIYISPICNVVVSFSRI